MFQSIWVYLTQFSRYDHDDGTDGQQTVGRPTDRLTLAIIVYLALEAGQQQEEFSDDLFNNYINRSFFVSRFRSTRFLRQYVMSSHSRDVATTLCPKKVYPLIFDNNFGKCGPIFKILSSPDSWENSLCTHTKTSISSVICCYTTSWQSKIQKCYWFLQHPQQTVDMFLRTLWTLALTFWQYRLLTLSDWLTFLKFVRRRLEWTVERCPVERCCIMVIFFTVIIFAHSSFFLHYTSCVVHVFE